MSKIVFVSGPAAMAKTTIKAKLASLAGVLGINFQRVILATSRPMRPGESEGNPWWFTTEDQIRDKVRANPQHYLSVQITGGDLQGLDTTAEIVEKLKNGGVLWCELDVNWQEEITQWLEQNMAPQLSGGQLKLVKVFFAPFSERELQTKCSESGCSWEQVVEQEMARRLWARREAGLDNAAIEILQKRAREAPKVLADRHTYDCIIVNHQGEESPEWGDLTEFPTGEAARVLSQCVEICRACDSTTSIGVVKRRLLADVLLKAEHAFRIQSRSGPILETLLKSRLDAIPQWYWTWRPLMHVCISNERGLQDKAKHALEAAIEQDDALLSIIIGASGAGKQVLVDHVRKAFSLERIVLLNTRTPRDDQERAGRQYEFVTGSEWEALRRSEELLAEKVYGTHWVGVRRWQLEEKLNMRRCILECPARLALEIADRYPARLYFVSVFSDATLWKLVEQGLDRWKPSEEKKALIESIS